MATNHETTVAGVTATSPGERTNSGTGSPPELVVLYPWGPSGPAEIGVVPGNLRAEASAILAGKERIALDPTIEGQLNGVASEVADILRSGVPPISRRDGYVIPDDIGTRLARELAKFASHQTRRRRVRTFADVLRDMRAADRARARWFAEFEERDFGTLGELLDAAIANPGKKVSFR